MLHLNQRWTAACVAGLVFGLIGGISTYSLKTTDGGRSSPVAQRVLRPHQVIFEAQQDQSAIEATVPPENDDDLFVAKTDITTSSFIALKQVANRGEAFVVGDSLTVGATPWLKRFFLQRGFKLKGVDAKVGRHTAEGLKILRSHKKELPDTIVVALGTNDLGSTSQQVMGWVRDARVSVGSRRIVWINLCLNDARSKRLASYRRINNSLASAARIYGVEVADWCGFAESHGIRNVSDGVHYDAPAYQKRAEFYARVVSRKPLPITTPRGSNDGYVSTRTSIR